MKREIIIDSHKRTLTYTLGKEKREYPVSLGEKGLGNEDGSGKTPTGHHLIFQKVGENAPLGTIFSSRKATGKVWKQGDPHQENLILTRILWLEGTEEGVNRGDGVDTQKRYIYIHGTNCQEAVGKKDVSHGCILMKNSDVIELFEQVSEGDHVIIN